MGKQAWSAVIAAPFGRVGLRCSEEAVQHIELLPASQPLQAPQGDLAQAAVDQIQAYLDDPWQVFTLPIVRGGTPFQQRVWTALREIPPGQTRLYSELARELGSAARAVGGACRRNPLPLLVPCHRVIAVNGYGGFAGARGGELLNIKRWLLAHERAASLETAAQRLR